MLLFEETPSPTPTPTASTEIQPVQAYVDEMHQIETYQLVSCMFVAILIGVIVAELVFK